MVNWIIIVVIVLVGYLILKFGNLKHRFFMIILLLFALFLYLTMAYVNRQNSLDFTSADGIMRSLKIYTGWLGHGFGNLKTLTGQAIKMDWTNTNGSFLDKKTSTDSMAKTNNKASVTFK